MDSGLIAAQAQLEQKRREQKIAERPSSPTPATQITGEVISRIEPTSLTEVEECKLHRQGKPCPVCAELNAIEDKKRQDQKVKRLKGIAIGTRYQGVSFVDYQPTDAKAKTVLDKCRSFAGTFRDRLKVGDSLLMLGNPGTGKNMLAACICSEIIDQGFTPLHTTALKLVRKIKESWGKDAPATEQEMINRFTEPDLLVIDEVGVQFGSKTEEILLFEVVNERYENMRPTIIISNLTIEGVQGYLGTRIVDRFYEGKSAVLSFTWQSYRRKR